MKFVYAVEDCLCSLLQWMQSLPTVNGHNSNLQKTEDQRGELRSEISGLVRYVEPKARVFNVTNVALF